MTHKRLVALVLFVVCLGCAVGIYTAHSSSQTRVKQQQEKAEKIPVIDFDDDQAVTADVADLRRNRSSKYKADVPIEERKEQNAVLRDLPLSHSPVQSAIPADQSDAVVTGTVTDAKAVLFPDKSDVYSEFSIRIDSVYKNVSPISLAADSSITTERVGGIVRFRSGKTLLRGVLGRGFPEPGSKYLLFLKWDEAGKDFPIITGYRLDGGKVLALDGTQKGGETPIYAEYKSLNGKDTEYLLQLLNHALAKTSGEVTNK